ncbi:uncharacterized protein B0H64DRAFT_363456 [Chaetomium fimeti]|uniref:SET domain-containing protein n=1 Tax=Chaetomium fimeti TaxID=1854472 RepID=A0AAE0HAS3_9PEZI|nr:hypothetical protein B0H64DRAFT_363456 [Chaetomium fimeti]
MRPLNLTTLIPILTLLSHPTSSGATTPPSPSPSPSPSPPPPPPPPQCGPATPKTPTHPQPTTSLATSLPHPSAWHPWTHQPYCIPASASPWCVFTHAASPRAHGVSIVSTPDDAPDPRNHALDAPFFAPEKLLLPRPYAVRDVPGKGKGVVATRRIAKGRVVLVDWVSVLAAVEYPGDVLRGEVQELLRVAGERLGGERVVEGLARQGNRRVGGDADGEGEGVEMSEMEDVMLTNSFAVTVGGKEYMGLFADLARFNHACKPNAFINFSQKTLAMTIWSARNIEVGEEITITYSAAGLTSEERHESLENIWGFKCQCSLCTSEPAALHASDDRRRGIRTLQDKVIELAQKGDFHEAVEASERLFTLVEQEGLTEQMGGMYEVPARLYYHIGNLEKALEYTLQARHEIDGYGVPDENGEEKIKMLKGVIARLEQEIDERGQGRAERERQGEDER